MGSELTQIVINGNMVCKRMLEIIDVNSKNFTIYVDALGILNEEVELHSCEYGSVQFFHVSFGYMIKIDVKELYYYDNHDKRISLPLPKNYYDEEDIISSNCELNSLEILNKKGFTTKGLENEEVRLIIDNKFIFSNGIKKRPAEVEPFLGFFF